MNTNEQTFDLKAEHLFHFSFKVVAVILALAAIGYFTSFPLVAIVLLLGSAFIFTAHRGIEINRVLQTYREYHSFLFIKTGKFHSYRSIEKIFINSGRESQRLYTAHTTSSSVFTNKVFRGYLKFDDGIKVLLSRQSDKEKLQARLKQIAVYLQIPVVDQSL